MSEQHGRILEQLGVHHVVYPEKDMGRRVAHLVRGAAIDYFEIEHGLLRWPRSPPPASIIGMPLGETTHPADARRHRSTAFRHARAALWQNADNDTVLSERATPSVIVGPDRPGAEAFAQLR